MIIFTKKKLLAIATAAFMISGCSSNEGASNQATADQTQETVRIGYPNILSVAPAIIAEKQKLMEEQGIKAEFYQFANGPDLNKALASGKLDIAYTGIPVVVNWASKGSDISVIAKVGDGEFGLIAKEDSSITQASDLESKKIGFLGRGTGSDILVRGFLLPEAQLDETSVSLMEMKMPTMEPAITKGTIDAALLGEPFVTFAELRGLKVVQKIPDPAVVVVAHNEFVEEHGDAVEKFMQGHQESIDYINEKPTEAAAVLAEAFEVPEIKADGKTWTPAEVMEQALAKQKYEAGFSDDDFSFYQQLADANYQLKLIDKPFEIKSVFNLKWMK